MKKILLVDDNEPFRRMLCRMLEGAGFSVVVAGDGVVALSLFRQQPFDLVITDLIMPEKEGLETILELRKLKGNVKIIAMSGGGRVDAGDYLPLAIAFGAARTLAKPFLAGEFLAAVAEVLADSSPPPPLP
jgi:CheY-like chemotaxis protein